MTRKKIYKSNKSNKYNKQKKEKKEKKEKKNKTPKKYITRKKLKYKKRKVTTKKTQRGGNLPIFCYENTSVCISLSHHSDEIKDKFVGFENVTQYNKIGQGANGFTTNIQYNISDSGKNLQLSNVLKSSFPSSDEYDNLMYEYLVGTFINKYNKIYPCFVETYGLYQYKGKHTTYCKGCKNKISGDNPCCEDYPTYTEFETEHPISMKYGKYKGSLNEILDHINTEALDLSKIYELLSDYGCNSSDSLAILINNIPSVPFITQCNNLIEENAQFNKNESLYVLFQIYIPLSLLGNKFTHYDLNMSNILLQKLKVNEYIEYNYYVNGEIITFKSQYIAKIIDYGRSYFHDDDDSHINTENIIKLILSNEICVPNKWDEDGDLKERIKTQLIKGDWFENDEKIYELLKPEFPYNIFKLQETSNISADLYLLIEVVYLLNTNFYEILWAKQLFDKIRWDGEYDTKKIMGMEHVIINPEAIQESGEDGKINNIHDAAKFFVDQVKKETNAESNKTYFAGKNKIGTLHIYLDKPMKFVEGTGDTAT